MTKRRGAEPEEPVTQPEVADTEPPAAEAPEPSGLTLADVQSKLGGIKFRAAQGDAHVASTIEATLHRDVLRALVEGGLHPEASPVEVGRAALSSAGISFQRFPR